MFTRRSVRSLKLKSGSLSGRRNVAQTTSYSTSIPTIERYHHRITAIVNQKNNQTRLETWFSNRV